MSDNTKTIRCVVVSRDVFDTVISEHGTLPAKQVICIMPVDNNYETFEWLEALYGPQTEAMKTIAGIPFPLVDVTVVQS